MRIINIIIGMVFGFFIGWFIFGLEILPNTSWTWRIGDPIEMEGTIIPTDNFTDDLINDLITEY